MDSSDDQQDDKTKNAVNKKNGTKKKLLKVISIVIGSVIALALAIFLIVTFATSAPSIVSDELVADIQALKGTETYNLLSDDAKATTSPAEVESIVTQLGIILTNKAEVQSKEISIGTDKRTTATIVYKIIGNDGVTYDLTVTLVENNGKWQVLNFESKARK